MPTRALHMRKVRELIRLKYEARLSHEQIAGALAISKGVVAKYVARIERTGLAPVVLMSMSDAEVMARIALAPRPASYSGRIKPDFCPSARRAQASECDADAVVCPHCLI